MFAGMIWSEFHAKPVHRSVPGWCLVLGLARALLTPMAIGSSDGTGPAALFSAHAIISKMRLVDDWQVAHPIMPTGNRNWERGTWYTGVMAAYRASGDRRYLDQALRWGEEQQWKPGTERAGANVLTCSQTYLELYFLTNNRAFIEPTIAWLDSGRPNTPTGATVWYLDEIRYVDSLYVGAPTLAMLAKATGDHKYIDWMNAFFWDVHREVFDQDDGLFYRDKSFIGQKTADGRKVIWSRGNGWGFASIPRILAYLPKNEPGRSEYETLFKQLAAAIIGRQQPDGLWRPNLDDALEYPVPETSGTSFFCFGLAWGIHNGLLDPGTYLPVVRRAWSGLVTNVSPEGKVQWGQLVDGGPNAVKQSDSHEYVTGAFLLAGSEMLVLAEAGALDGDTGLKPIARAH